MSQESLVLFHRPSSHVPYRTTWHPEFWRNREIIASLFRREPHVILSQKFGQRAHALRAPIRYDQCLFGEFDATAG